MITIHLTARTSECKHSQEWNVLDPYFVVKPLKFSVPISLCYVVCSPQSCACKWQLSVKANLCFTLHHTTQNIPTFIFVIRLPCTKGNC